MSNLRSDCRKLAKKLPVGDVYRVHIECLCHQIDLIEEYWHNANQRIKDIRDSLEQIVVTDGEDAGVILKSSESPTEFCPALNGQVYIHEHFSELGDALVKLHQKCVIE